MEDGDLHVAEIRDVFISSDGDGENRAAGAASGKRIPEE